MRLPLFSLFVVLCLSLALLLTPTSSPIAAQAPTSTPVAQVFLPSLLNQQPSRMAQSDLVGRLGGESRAVRTQDHYAFLGIGLDFAIIDISDISQPRQVGSVAFSREISIIRVQNSLAYVVDYSSTLHIVDISDPALPHKLSSYDAEGFIEDILVVNNWVYVAASSGGLRVLDVSTPTSPGEEYVLSNSWAGYSFRPKYVRAYGSHLIVVVDTSFYIIDISMFEPEHPIAQYDASGYIEAISIFRDYVYVGTSTTGVQIVDISDVTIPREVGSDPSLKPYLIDIETSFGYLIVGVTINILDLSDPLIPRLIGQYSALGIPRDLHVRNGYAFVADGINGLRIIDVSNPALPVAVSRFRSVGFTRGIQVIGQYAYLAGGGLTIVDVSNPALPVVVSSVSVQGGAAAVAVVDNYAYLAIARSCDSSDCRYGLRIVDISNKKAPILVGAFDTPEWGIALSVVDGYAYLITGQDPGDYRDSLWIIDVTNPPQPRQLSRLRLHNYAHAITVQDGFAYLAQSSDGLEIIDVSDPTIPHTLPRLEIGIAYDVAVRGQYVYSAGHTLPLYVVNISLPFTPRTVGRVMPPGLVTYSHIDSTEGYVIATAYGNNDVQSLRILDVRDSNRPIEVSYTPIPYDALDLSVSGQYAYVVIRYAGLLIYRLP